MHQIILKLSFIYNFKLLFYLHFDIYKFLFHVSCCLQNFLYINSPFLLKLLDQTFKVIKLLLDIYFHQDTRLLHLKANHFPKYLHIFIQISLYKHLYQTFCYFSKSHYIYLHFYTLTYLCHVF